MKRRILLVAFCIAIVCGGFSENNAQKNNELINRAKAAIEKNDLDSALRDLDTVLSAEPGDLEALTQRARVYIMQKKTDAAFADAEKVLAAEPKNVVALNVRGLVKAERKDYDGAISDFTQAMIIDPKFTKAYRNRAFAKKFKNDTLPSVLMDYDGFLVVEPQNLAILQEAGNYCLEKGGEIARCAGYFQKIKQFKPDSAIGYLGYALAYGNNFNKVTDKNFLSVEVAANFRKAFELDPKNKIAPLHLGRLLLNLEDYDGSIAALTEALTLDPKDAWAWAMRGDDYRLKKSYDRALADYTKAIEINRDYLGAYKYRAKTAWAKLVETNTPYQTDAQKSFFEQTYNDFKKWAQLSEQDYDAYKELHSFATNFARYAAAEQKDPALKGRIEKQTEDFYRSLIAANPQNVCARNFLLESSDYFGKHQAEWDELIAKYDGKNGAQCASAAALWIGRNIAEGNMYSNPPVPRDEAKARRYYELALKFNPQAEYVRDWIAKLPKEPTVVSSGTYNSSPSTSSTSRSSTPSPDNTRVKEAIAEYDRVHESVEADIKNYNDAMEKYNKAGEAQFLFKGTYGRALRALDAAARKIEQFLDQHGKYLPKAMYDHMVSDYRKAGGVKNY